MVGRNTLINHLATVTSHRGECVKMVTKLPVKEFDLLEEASKFEARVEVLLIAAKRLKCLALPLPQSV